mgnify:FL=1
MRAFKCNHGFQAQADVPINSPTQTNNQNVNVIVNNLTKDKEFHLVTDEEHKQYQNVEIQNRAVDLKVDEGLNDELEPTFKERTKEQKLPGTRSLETAKEGLDEMQTLLKDKDNLIEALSLILDIYENNPLIVNKLIIAEEEVLTRLLFLLTGAEEIQLIKSDPETGCTCKIDKFQYIQKIMIKKNGNLYNFKYSFPNVVQLLDNRRINYKVVV